MICQTCNRQIETAYEDKKSIYVLKECPEGHVAMDIHEGKITHYRFYFEKDEVMYQVSGNHLTGIQLLSKKVTRPHKRGGFKQILKIPQYIKPILKEDIIQVEYLFNKLKKLVIFS